MMVKPGKSLIAMLFTAAALAAGTFGCEAQTPTPPNVPAPQGDPPHHSQSAEDLLRDMDIRSICLAVEPYYPQFEEGGEPSFPIAETIRDILAGAGFDVMGKEDSCDLSISVSVEFTAVGEEYVVQDVFHHPTGETEFCYTAVEYSGSIEYLDGITYFNSGPAGPHTPDTVYDCPSLSEAPFDEVWNIAVQSTVYGLWYWNPEVLVHGLQSDDDDVRCMMAGNLDRSAEQAEIAIPALISALEAEEAAGVRECMLDSLRTLSREDLGDDTAAWREWWENTSRRDRKRIMDPDLRIHWLSYPAGCCSAFCLVLFIYAMVGTFAMRRARRSIGKDAGWLANAESVSAFEQFIEKHLRKTLSAKQLSPVDEALEDARRDFSKKNRSRLVEMVGSALDQWAAQERAARITFLVGSMLGLLFIAWQLWRVY
jgi:hypothetical protein